MSDASDAIIHAMSNNTAPIGGWTMPDLRRLTGLSVGAFAGALSALRTQGKVHPFDLALAPAMWPVDAEPVPAAAQTIAQQVDQEAREAGANRRVAAMTGLNNHMPASLGAQLQERALADSPQLAAGILRDRWGPTWHRLCRHAEMNRQRPVTALIALLDSALDREAAA